MISLSKKNCALVLAACAFLLSITVLYNQYENSTKLTAVLGKPTTTADPEELTTVKENIKKCFDQSHISSDTELLSLAQSNGELFMKEYRRVIPRVGFKNHSSHCWNIQYSASTRSWPLHWVSRKVTGHIGGLAFDRSTHSWFGENEFNDLSSNFDGHFSTNVVCLPKTYLLGFEKCGSTYLWCFISKVISAFTENNHKSSDKYHADKEPYFWTPFEYTKSLPDANTIGNPYLLDFLHAADPKISKTERKHIMLIDGTPATGIEWPNFREEDPDLANYCLLPGTLPELFPDSKYVVIMRDPVKMLYSNFWWSYKFHTTRLDYARDLYYVDEGPDVFHQNSLSKVESFLDCFRDESQSPCPFPNAVEMEFSECVSSRRHLIGKCVHNITTKRKRKESAIHRGIYLAHVQKWLSVLPPERILFLTLERLSKHPAEVTTEILEFFEVSSNRNKVPLTDENVKEAVLSCSTNSDGVIDYKHSDDIKHMLPETETMLKAFYAPFNDLLSKHLDSDHFLWGS